MSTKEMNFGNLIIAQQWRSSGMTLTDYARANRISIHTLRYWLYKHKDTVSEEGSFLRLTDLSSVNDFHLGQRKVYHNLWNTVSLL